MTFDCGKSTKLTTGNDMALLLLNVSRFNSELICRGLGKVMLVVGDAMLVLGDVMLVLGDVMLAVGDAMLVVGDTMLVLGDTMLVLGDTMLEVGGTTNSRTWSCCGVQEDGSFDNQCDVSIHRPSIGTFSSETSVFSSLVHVSNVSDSFER